jgi:very-short-patch-repair endonuclease
VRLVVEVDGPYHADPVAATGDIARESWLRAGGLVVLRLTDDEVLHHPDRALRRIRRKLRQLRYLALARRNLAEISSTDSAVGQDP